MWLISSRYIITIRSTDWRRWNFMIIGFGGILGRSRVLQDFICRGWIFFWTRILCFSLLCGSGSGLGVWGRDRFWKLRVGVGCFVLFCRGCFFWSVRPRVDCWHFRPIVSGADRRQENVYQWYSRSWYRYFICSPSQ